MRNFIIKLATMILCILKSSNCFRAILCPAYDLNMSDPEIRHLPLELCASNPKSMTQEVPISRSLALVYLGRREFRSALCAVEAYSRRARLMSLVRMKLPWFSRTY